MLVIVAGAMGALFGVAALAVDLGNAYATAEQLRATADSAVLAAAARLPDRRAATDAALRLAEKNMPAATFGNVLQADSIVFGAWDARTRSVVASRDAPSAVSLTVSLADARGNALRTYFAPVFGIDSLDLGVTATAGRRASSCVVALDPNATQTMEIQQNASINALNCEVQVNSTDPVALDVKKGASLTAEAICVTGGANVSAGAFASPMPAQGCPPVADPLAGLPKPESGWCDHTNLKVAPLKVVTLSPGVYCGGVQIKAASVVTLLPGLYVFKDGPLAVQTGASVVGLGVTLYFTGNGAVTDVTNGAIFALIAPVSGPLAGIMLYQDPDFGGVHVWDGIAPNVFTGTIYLPGGEFRSQTLTLITPLNSCNVLIAREIFFSQRSGMSIDMTNPACQSALPAALRGAVALLD